MRSGANLHFHETVAFCVSRKTRVSHRRSLSQVTTIAVFTFVVGSIQKLDYVEWFIVDYESARDIIIFTHKYLADQILGTR